MAVPLTAHHRMSRSVITLLLILILAGGGLIVAAALGAKPETFVLLLGLYILSSIMFAALPLLICYVQTVSIARQVSKLDTFSGSAVSYTQHFQNALTNLRSINPAILDKYYALPMLTFACVILYCWTITTTAYIRPDFFTAANVILGGLFVVNSPIDPIAVLHYQQGTFVAACFGFIGAYIYILWRLLDRINNDDIYPISFYYFSVRIVAAMLISSVIRHVMPEIAGVAPTILLSFAAGFVPDVFVVSLLRRASAAMHMVSDQDDPKNNVLPSNFSLLMIQGLDRDKIDRLAELNVTNAQVLAYQNPFILWLRLPYELLLVIEWISQAQLYRTLKEPNLVALRELCVTGVLDFIRIGSDPKGRDAIAAKVGLSADSLEALVSSLTRDPAFQRLWEVDVALAARKKEDDRGTP
jgi:hypothetical protein